MQVVLIESGHYFFLSLKEQHHQQQQVFILMTPPTSSQGQKNLLQVAKLMLMFCVIYCCSDCYNQEKNALEIKMFITKVKEQPFTQEMSTLRIRLGRLGLLQSYISELFGFLAS